ncbi:ABC transporter substrate-binding protein, partial [Paenibacillus sp. TAF58]
MSTFKKSWLLLVATSLIVVSACSSKTSETGKPDTTGSKDVAASDSGFTKGKYDPPIEISTVVMFAPPKKYVKGDTKENNVHDRWMLETLGIKHKDTWYPAGGDQYKQKLQLAIASGEKLPDFVFVPTDPVLTNQLIDSGQFVAIDTL